MRQNPARPRPKLKFGSFWYGLERFIDDYRRLWRSRLFMHWMYSQCYFKTGSLSWLALAHYILVGEERGYCPNPFFDPAYFERQSATRRLVDYLDQPPLWAYATSAYFDSRWYSEMHAADLQAAESPLEHFWTKGFDRGNDPSSRFDMKFFADAIARDHADKREFAYEYLPARDPAAPLNSDELEKRQSDFYDAVRLEILRAIKAPRKRFLVFIQCGKNFVPRYDCERALFDTLVNYYDASERVTDKVQYVFRQNGTKTTAIRKTLEVCPELLLGYDAVLFLDDDVIISQDQIERLFQTREEHQLDLLQGSLTADSDCFYPVLKQPMAGKGLRRLSGIEIMMPLVSRRALQDCSWVFAESISGWGVDTLLSAEVRKRFGDTIALLGDVVCAHNVRRFDPSGGTFYRFLRKYGIEATVEAGRIAMKFGLNDKADSRHFLEPDRSVP